MLFILIVLPGPYCFLPFRHHPDEGPVAFDSPHVGSQTTFGSHFGCLAPPFAHPGHSVGQPLDSDVIAHDFVPSTPAL